MAHEQAQVGGGSKEVICDGINLQQRVENLPSRYAISRWPASWSATRLPYLRGRNKKREEPSLLGGGGEQGGRRGSMHE